MPEWKEEIRKRLADLKLEPTRESEIVEELAQHLEDRYAELVASGQSDEKAARALLAEMSSGRSVANELRRIEPAVTQEPMVLGSNARSSFFGGLWQDIRYGARMLLDKPGFTSIAVLTLGLGLGANTAIFSVVNAVLLRPLPFKEPSRLVTIWERRPTSGETNVPVAAYEFVNWREQTHTFESLALIQPAGLNLTGKGDPEMINAWWVSSDFFPLLDVPMLMGRAFVEGEDQAGRNNIVVLDQKLWQRHYGSDPDIVGQTITMNDQSYTVVGVMPHLDLMPDAWVPIDLPGAQQLTGGNSHNGYQVMGRLKPGVTLAQAQADLAQLAGRLEQLDPNNNTGHGVQAIPLHENTVAYVQRALWILFGAVGFVLLIACANVANLLLTRMAARHKELAIRTALGATRLRLMRQLLTESLLLALLGGGFGLLLAFWLIGLLPKIKAVNLPRLEHLSVDSRVMAATLGFSLLTGLFTGIVPAWRSYAPNLNQRLNEGSRTSSGLGRPRGASLLVILEVALTLVLLIGSGLMLKSFVRLVRVDPGFNPSHLLRVGVVLPGTRYGKPEQQRAFYEQLIERINILPGVAAAAVTTRTPLRPGDSWSPYALEGRPVSAPGEAPYAAVRAVSADYFRVMQVPLRKGRAFTSFDVAQADRAIIVNETMARQCWPTEEALGRRLRIDNSPWLTVVGVVGDVHHGGLSLRPNPEIFAPYQQAPQAAMALLVRTTVEPLALAPAVREQVKALDQDLPAPITTMEQLFSDSVAGQRFNTLLLGLFGALALALAVVGVFGVINYSVAQRRHEIGVRMALGAQRRDILKMVLGQGLVLALVGVGIGLAGAFALTLVIADLLYGVSPHDAVTFSVVSLLLIGVAMLACFVPARWATKVDPMVALRYE